MTEMPITRQLPVALTPDEVRLHGETIARLERAYEVKADHAKEAAKAAKQELYEMRGLILDLAFRVERKQELREVPCHEEPNVDRQTVNLVRDDTGDVVETRAMTLTDHQISLWEPQSVPERQE